MYTRNDHNTRCCVTRATQLQEMEKAEKAQSPLAGVTVEGAILPLTFKWGFEAWR